MSEVEMILQKMVLLPGPLMLFDMFHWLFRPSVEEICHPMCGVAVVFVISLGVDVVVILERGEVLRVEDGIAVTSPAWWGGPRTDILGNRSPDPRRGVEPNPIHKSEQSKAQKGRRGVYI